MEARLGTLNTQHRAQLRERKFFLSDSDARIIKSADEAAPIRLGPAIAAMLARNRQRRRLCSCGPFARNLAS
jgi:hypothetical protein